MKAFSRFEGHVSGAAVESSTFIKLGIFMIVQGFFVLAFAGGLMTGLKRVLREPLYLTKLMAETLPSQSTFFMQVAFTRTVVYILKDNLRVVALVSAVLRLFFGPRATKRQRQKSYAGLRPLAKPQPFSFSVGMSQLCVFYFLVVLVRL